MWQNQKLLSIVFNPVSVGEERLNKESETGAFPLGFVVMRVGLVGCCCSGRSVTQNRANGNKKQASNLSLSNSDTDVTVNLTSFEELW